MRFPRDSIQSEKATKGGTLVQAVRRAVTCKADKDQIESEKNQVGVAMETKG